MNISLDSLKRLIWEEGVETMPWWKRVLLKGARFVYVILRDILQGQLNLRAMGLVYTTLLSLVPLIAVSFSVLKAFGVHNQVEPLLLSFLEPLGERGIEINNQIIGFVDNVRVGVLGSLGIAMLLYTAVSLIQKVEESFNYTWHVECNRSILTRFSSYLSVIVVGPVLVFSSMGITATLMSTAFVQTLVAIEPFGSLYSAMSMMLPFLLVIAAFSFVLLIIPNTTVYLRSAIVGGIVAGILWNITGRFFATFMVASTQYTAIYSGFAIVLLTMIWLYISWLIMLVGASIAFYTQHPEYMPFEQRVFTLSNRMKERLSLGLLALIGQRYYQDLPVWTVEALAERLKVPARTVAYLLKVYVNRGVLSRTDSDPAGFLPARPLEKTTLKQALDWVRSAEEDEVFARPNASMAAEIDTVMSELDTAMETALHDRTLKDLVVSESRQESGKVTVAPATE
jgi:membrane protein